MSLEIHQTGEVSATHVAAEKLQAGSPALSGSLPITLLGFCLALAVVPEQQAGQLKVQAAVLAGVRVAGVTAGQ